MAARRIVPTLALLAACGSEPTARVAPAGAAAPRASVVAAPAPAPPAEATVDPAVPPIAAQTSVATMVPLPASGARVDRLGDPLPAGALARFGTARLHHGGVVRGVGRFGPYLASVGDGIRLRGPSIKFWDAKTARLAATAHVAGVHAMALDRAGRYMVVASFERAFVYESIGSEIRSAALPEEEGSIHDVAITGDGRAIAVLRVGDCAVDVFETGPVRRTRRIACTNHLATRLAISDDGSLLAIGDEEGGVSVVDAASKRVLLTHVQRKPLRSPPALAFVPKTQELLEARADSTLVRWSPKARRALFELKDAFEGEASAIAVSGDGRDVAVGSTSGLQDVTMLSASTGKKIREVQLPGWGNMVYSIAFDGAGRVAVGCSEGSVEHFAADTGQRAALHEGGEDDVNAVAFLDEDRVLSFGARIEHWSIASPHAPPVRPLRDEDFYDFLVSEAGDFLFASGKRSLTKIRVRDWSTRGTLDRLEGGFHGASADRRYVFLGDFGTFLRIDTATMTKAPPLPGASETQTPKCVAVSRDGARVAAVLVEKTSRPRLYLWESTARPPLIVDRFSSGEDTLACEFAHGGALLIGTPQGIYRVDRKGTSKKVVNGRMIWTIAADPKRARVAFAETDEEKIALLDVATGAVREVGAHLDRTDELAFSPSGDRLASASADDTVMVWDVTAK